MTKENKTRVICLVGPTASGKTPLSLELAQQFPLEIISVDSAMVYRGMDIGTAKPEKTILQTIPHHLIDIADPKEIYSAGRFYQDALEKIATIVQQGKIPLLVGGTMMYFRMLQQGIALLPRSNQEMRTLLQARANEEGLSALYEYLHSVDKEAAERIHAQDKQRIFRALEVFELTGKNITTWQKEETKPALQYEWSYFALIPEDRELLHKRIALRFAQMLEQGFVEEVEQLYHRGDLHAELPSLRSVGYRQIWAYLAGQMNKNEMQEKAVVATRQLAKRQLTWLRSWPGLIKFSIDVPGKTKEIQCAVRKLVDGFKEGE